MTTNTKPIDAAPSDAPFATIEVEYREDGVTVATCILTELTFEGDGVGNWENDIGALIAKVGEKPLILDFSHVEVISSTALQYLIKLLFLTREKNLRLGLCGFRDNVWRIMKVTRLAELFLVGATVDDTLLAMEKNHDGKAGN